MAAWVPIALMAASAISGAMQNRNQRRETSNTPTLDPAYAGLQNLILPNIMNRLKQPSALPTGYVEGQTRQINEGFAGASTDLANRLSARGLSRSPVAAAGETSLANRRAGAITNMKAQVPMLEEEMRRQQIMDALNVLQMGRGNLATTTDFGGGRVNNSISGAAQMLGFLYGTGAFGGRQIGASVPAPATS